MLGSVRIFVMAAVVEIKIFEIRFEVSRTYFYGPLLRSFVDLKCSWLSS
jgi:hypothetical protein